MASTIPVYVVSFNNPTYVRFMLEQLLNKAITTNVVVVDNASTYPPTLQLLQEIDDGKYPGGCTKRLTQNMGPRIHGKLDLPSKYVLTDPDLMFHPDMPADVLATLDQISKSYGITRIGLALDISEPDCMYSVPYFRGRTICQWEQNFWKIKFDNSKNLLDSKGNPLVMYWAGIDTTFALINTEHKHGHVRMAGIFTAKHLPWYRQGMEPEGAPVVPKDESEYYKHTQKASSSARMLLRCRVP